MTVRVCILVAFSDEVMLSVDRCRMGSRPKADIRVTLTNNDLAAYKPNSKVPECGAQTWRKPPIPSALRSAATSHRT